MSHQDRRPTCAFLSTDDLEGFVVYDRLAVPAFAELGWRVEEVPWRRDEDWSRFAIVVVRTPWDYQRDPEAFLAVLARIAAVTRLENAAALCRWNLDKTYLRDLEARGVAVVPTLWRPPGAPLDAAVFAALGADEVVVKPTVSANADRTHRLHRRDLARRGDAVAADLAGRATMAQPFVASVLDEGETSLFYFDGVYSHAVAKTPRPGDFRVQEEHGGRIRAVRPDAATRAAGDAVMAALPSVPLYARVDLVRCAGRPCLMELELVEPSLYFPYDPGSPRRFAEATVRRAVG